MPLQTGLSTPNRTNATSPLSVLFLGAADDGPIGEARWFTSPEAASYSYGGVAVGRLSPSPTDATKTFDAHFVPDDPTLMSATQVYHVNPANGLPIRFTGLGRWTAQNSPVQFHFDPLGYAASNQIFDGGLFFETAGDAQRPLGGLVLPMRSALLEAQQDDPNGICPIGACRVGASWLPDQPPSLSVTVVTSSGNATFVLQCSGQGNGSATDRYLTCQAIVRPTALVLDPGHTGLPYRRLTYTYAKYATWNALWLAIQQDFQDGKHPFRIMSRPTLGDSKSQSVPGGGYVGDEATVTVNAAYAGLGFPEPDLTAAEAWAEIFEKEDLPLDCASLLCASGLTAKALAEDTSSALRIFEALDAHVVYNDENPDLTLVLPWSNIPPTEGAVYDPSDDLDLFQTLQQALGPQLSGRLLVFWGTAAQMGIPSHTDRSLRIIPAAYAILGAMVRESDRSTPPSGIVRNVLHPPLKTILISGVPAILVNNAAAPSGDVTPQGVPGPAALTALSSAGLPALTRAIGDRWSVHGPILRADGTSIRRILIQAALRDDCQQILDPYIGRINSAKTRQDLQAAIRTLETRAVSGLGALSPFIATYDLTMLYDPDLQISSWDTIELQGQVTLYGEVGSIVFQLSLGAN